MILRILERYIARAVLRATLLTILALAFLLVFFTFVDELDDVHQAQYQVVDAFMVALLAAPRHLFEVFPMAALIGGLLGLGGLARHTELIAMRAGGFTVKHINYAVLKVGLIMLLLAVFIGEWLAPNSAQYAQQLRLAKQQGQVTSAVSEHGFWARDNHQFIHIERVISGNHLQGINLFEFNAADALVLNRRAATADYRDGYWLLQDIRQSVIQPNQVTTQNMAQMRWDSALDPALLSLAVAKPARLPVWDIHRYIRFMQANGQDATSYRVAFWSRLATPVLTLLLLWLAVPFALVKQRSGTGQRIFIGAMIGALFFLLMRSASYASVVYDLNPLLLMFIPAMLSLVMTLWLIRRVR